MTTRKPTFRNEPLEVYVPPETLEALEAAAEEQHISVRDYAAGLLREAMQGQWVSVHALMEMADEIRARPS